MLSRAGNRLILRPWCSLLCIAGPLPVTVWRPHSILEPLSPLWVSASEEMFLYGWNQLSSHFTTRSCLIPLAAAFALSIGPPGNAYLFSASGCPAQKTKPDGSSIGLRLCALLPFKANSKRLILTATQWHKYTHYFWKPKKINTFVSFTETRVRIPPGPH